MNGLSGLSKNDFYQWIALAQRLWLFLDYDGTLAEFAPTPDQVQPNQQIIDLITLLSRKSKIRLAVISGQCLSTLQTLLPVPGIFLGGTYGIELQTPYGEVLCRVEEQGVRTILDVIKPQLLEMISGKRGFYLEDKGLALALHARFADELEAEQVICAARQLPEMKNPPPHFRILGGHKFLEIAPVLANKGSTVTYLLANYTWPEAWLAYLGDDDKDQEAFKIVKSLDGLAVLVLHPNGLTSDANIDYVFESPREVRAWLKILAR
jgi:trehalose 6-phosphate phosphatase